jgi:hypothetical protein
MIRRLHRLLRRHRLPDFPPPETALVGGQHLTHDQTHRRVDCIGRTCPIHNPSPHHMRHWTQRWRGHHNDWPMERICPHDVPHPDPDDPAPNRFHVCDGCCYPPPPELPAVRGREKGGAA